MSETKHPEDNLSGSSASPESAAMSAGNESLPVDIPDGWVTAAGIAREFELTPPESAAGIVGKLAARHGLEYAIRRLPNGMAVRAFPPESAITLRGLVADLPAGEVPTVGG
jgi:hypothetical protein